MTKTLWSYSRMRAVRPAELFVARTTEDIASTLGRAARQSRRATVRAGARSFDDQALNDDIVIDVSSLDRVLEVDRDAMTVQAGASWGTIVEASLKQDLLPYVLVTTRGATAGGTLSSNCLSRSTPRHGHTGDHVRSFRLLTVDGRLLECTRDTNRELFHAVIGGFGLFGVVTEVTYAMHRLNERTNVKTTIERTDGLREFVDLLVERSLASDDWDAVYSVFSLAHPQRGAVLRSAYTHESSGETLHLYEPDAWYRPIAELLFLSSRVGNALCHASYRWVFQRGTFVSDLDGYTFCMEANERARDMAEKVGVRMRSLQPSYVVPKESLYAFLNVAARVFVAHDVYPALLDALYLPANDYLLSAANGLAGFCVSFTFAGILMHRYERIRRAMIELNDVAIAMGARINLIKDVHATPAQIRGMYGHALDDLARMKSKWDPNGVLVSDFYERAFGV